MDRLGWGASTTIRVRLAAALAVALLPVLLLGAVQTGLAFRADAELRRESLTQAAERSAVTARARVEAAGVLLRTLGPGSTGLECAPRLYDVQHRIPGYANLVRFDAAGRVVCAAVSAPADPQRGQRPWFKRLRSGSTFAVDPRPAVAYADQPAMLAAVRADQSDGAFDGALAAVITLSSLQPEKGSRALPDGAEVALAGPDGAYFAATDRKAFPSGPTNTDKIGSGSRLWDARDEHGRRRVLSAAPLVGDQVYVVLSAPAQGLFSWARLDPMSRLVLPVFGFIIALGTVLWAADRGVLRWIVYLQRVASIYAKGRFSVRPIQADRAPPEIRQLAQTLDDMAGAIVARDASLHENLAQKDGLMREIHHRVKNNLQVISSLLSLQQRALDDVAARQAISDTRQRITALALVYRALYQGPDLKRVDLRPFLEELVAQLMSGEVGPQGSVRTEVHADPLMIDPDRLAPLALFAVETISNAQKHAFADRGAGTLTVEFHVRDQEAEFSIADDGGGAMGPAAAPDGMGRTLMNAFARQLRGRTVFDTPQTGGLKVTLHFPAPEAVSLGEETAKAAEPS